LKVLRLRIDALTVNSALTTDKPTTVSVKLWIKVEEH